MDISVVLPTYCERDNIVSLISAIEQNLLPLGWEFEILVVDDNSPDCTSEVVQAYQASPGVRVECFTRTDERGLATAILRGIKKSRGDIIVVMDTDFNHSPDNLPQLIQSLENFDLAIGSRFVRGGGMEDKQRYIFSLIYNWFIRLALQHGVHDSLSGFFAIHRQALYSLKVERIFQGYGEYFIRLTFLAFQQKYKVIEVPVFYSLRQHGFSKSKFGDMLRNYTFCVLNLRFMKSS